MLNTGYWLLVTALRIPHDTPTASHSSLPTAYLILGAQQLRGVVARGGCQTRASLLEIERKFLQQRGCTRTLCFTGERCFSGQHTQQTFVVRVLDPAAAWNLLVAAAA